MYGFYGTAISDGNSKSHKASTADGQPSSKAEPHDSHHATFGFHLYLLPPGETYNICTIWEYWIGGKFSCESFMPSPRNAASKLPPDSPEHAITLRTGCHMPPDS